MSRFAETEVQVAAAGMWMVGMAVVGALSRAEDNRRLLGWQAYHASRARNAQATADAIAEAEDEADRIRRVSRLERQLFAARRASRAA